MEFIVDLDDLESGRVREETVRKLMRHGLARQLATRDADGVEAQFEKKRRYIAELRKSPIAVAEGAANAQHYEQPPAFFDAVLGPHRKYSACYWGEGVTSLADAEEATLRLMCERARIEDGQRILDLGCGWGALSLYLAEHYPKCTVTGLSNSAPQKAAIEARRDERGLKNLTIITANFTDLAATGTYDRIMSVEMFEHLRNYERVFAKVASLLTPEGLAFVHVFTHMRHAYLFEGDWTAEYFFTGGQMPSDDLFLHFTDDLRVIDHWIMDGTHYQKTSEAWLARLHAAREQVMPILKAVHGEKAAHAFQMWRLFFLVTAESFGFRNGQEWVLSHYLFRRAR